MIRSRAAANAASEDLRSGSRAAAQVAGPRPAPPNRGTRVEVQDLFYATPARLKFLKSERAENGAIADVVKRLAMAHRGRGLHPGQRRAHDLARCRRPTASTPTRCWRGSAAHHGR